MEHAIRHFDGADVVVTDLHGQCLRAVDEVRVEPDRAEVRLSTSSDAWPETLEIVEAGQLPAYVIRSAHDRQLHWQGPVRLVCV
jgi:hypothetical protein